MKHHEFFLGRVGRRRFATLTAVTALVAASAVTVGVGSASASRSSNGRMQVCASSAHTQTVKYVISKTGWSKTVSLRTKAHHTTCSTSISLKSGSYKVTQRTPNGLRVSKIAIAPTSHSLARNAVGSWAKARVHARQLTRVTYGNVVIATPPVVPKPPTPTQPTKPADPGKGYIEVCKQAGDGFVHGNVTINITAGATKYSQVVPVGQCTDALQVPAGTALVSEVTDPLYYLSKVRVEPASALVEQLPPSAVQVKVAKSTDSSIETLVTLVNSTKMGKFKVCKTLSANAGDLIASGHNAFAFGIKFPGAFPGTQLDVVVPTLGQAACKLFPISLPLGTPVLVTEKPAWGAEVTGVSVEPASQDRDSAGDTASFVLGPNHNGITTASFVNRADGTIEVCKQIDNGWMTKADALATESLDGWTPYQGLPFKFSINGGDPITVLAGQCSRPIAVPAGTATVEELPFPFFNLVGFTATGPDGSSRLVSGTNPITVNAPAGGVSNETLVMATNRVQMGQVKVCKMLDPGVPFGPFKSYTFATTFWIGPKSFTGYVKLTPTGIGPAGEVCGFLSAPVPVIDLQLHPTAFKVVEGASPFGLTTSGDMIVEPTDISYDGGGFMGPTRHWLPGDSSSWDGHYYGTATIGQGVNVMTFTNGLVLDP